MTAMAEGAAISRTLSEYALLVLGRAYACFTSTSVSVSFGPLVAISLTSPNPGAVVLVLCDVRLQRRPLVGHEHVLEGAVGHLGRPVQLQRLGHVFGHTLLVLLPVGLPDLRVLRHDDAGLGAFLADLPRAAGARDLAVLDLF